MSPRKALPLLIATGVMVGVVAMYWIAFPPNPMNPWIAASFTVSPAEHWWYSLPEGDRTQRLYSVVVGLASWVYPAVVAASFIAWCWALRKGEGIYPRRSLWAAGIIFIGSAAWYAAGWGYGVQYQGSATLMTYIAATLIYLAVLGHLWRRGRRTGSWGLSLLWHVGLFLWFCGFAFPWLGELCC